MLSVSGQPMTYDPTFKGPIKNRSALQWFPYDHRNVCIWYTSFVEQFNFLIPVVHNLEQWSDNFRFIKAKMLVAVQWHPPGRNRERRREMLELERYWNWD